MVPLSSVTPIASSASRYTEGVDRQAMTVAPDMTFSSTSIVEPLSKPPLNKVCELRPHQILVWLLAI
jgi:hypothetical protein